MSTTLTQRKDKESTREAERRQSVQLRLRPSVYAKVKREAERHGVSYSYVIERSIESFEGLK
jgi:predicted DNA binding CopG/RHH family protein